MKAILTVLFLSSLAYDQGSGHSVTLTRVASVTSPIQHLLFPAARPMAQHCRGEESAHPARQFIKFGLTPSQVVAIACGALARLQCGFLARVKIASVIGTLALHSMRTTELPFCSASQAFVFESSGLLGGNVVGLPAGAAK
jgi:hypothetical protein